MELLNLNEIADGALQEKINAAMRKVLENMQDPSTPYKVKRGITVKLGFTQTESRGDAVVDVSVETKLAPASPLQTMMSIGKDLRSGEVYAEEYGKQVKGQMSLDMAKLAQVDGDTVDTETGEVVSGNIVDYRKAAL